MQRAFHFTTPHFAQTLLSHLCFRSRDALYWIFQSPVLTSPLLLQQAAIMCLHIFTLHVCGHRHVEHAGCDLLANPWQTLFCPNYNIHHIDSQTRCSNDGSFCVETWQGRELQDARARLAECRKQCISILVALRMITGRIAEQNAGLKNCSANAISFLRNSLQRSMSEKGRLSMEYTKIVRAGIAASAIVSACRLRVQDRRDSTTIHDSIAGKSTQFHTL